MTFDTLSPPYDVIVADPLWNFASNSAARPGRNARRHYACMSLDAIAELPIKSLAARDSLLFLWTTAPFAELAFRVVHGWGFVFKTELIWRKDRIATGFWTRGQHEKVYLCRRGRFPCPRPAPFMSSVIDAPVREHSRKPPELQDRIEEVWPEARKLELFARTRRSGWDAWGNETERFQHKKFLHA